MPPDHPARQQIKRGFLGIPLTIATTHAYKTCLNTLSPFLAFLKEFLIFRGMWVCVCVCACVRVARRGQYSLARASEYHRLGASPTRMCFSTVLEAASVRLSCRQGRFLPRPPLGLQMAIFLSVSSHSLPSMHADVQIASFYEDTSHTGYGPTLMTSF